MQIDTWFSGGSHCWEGPLTIISQTLLQTPDIFAVYRGEEMHAQEADWIKTQPSARVLSLLDKEPEITIIVALEQLGSATARKAGRKRRAELIVHQRHVSWGSRWPAANPTGEQLDLGVIFRCLKHNHLVRKPNALCNRYKKTSSGMIFVRLNTSAHAMAMTSQPVTDAIFIFKKVLVASSYFPGLRVKVCLIIRIRSEKPGDHRHQTESKLQTRIHL